MNLFPRFPTSGLRSLVHVKTHNNPNLVDFPGSAHFPKVRSLVLSYAYHCCQFLPSTYENQLPDYTTAAGGVSGGGLGLGDLQVTLNVMLNSYYNDALTFQSSQVYYLSAEK